jgi:hypothetical protein
MIMEQHLILGHGIEDKVIIHKNAILLVRATKVGTEILTYDGWHYCALNIDEIHSFLKK